MRKMIIYKYKEELNRYKRRKSIEVQIGNTAMGGNNPIRIQSMTNTNTLDTNATVEQSIRMIEAGAEYVRITTQNIKEAENLIKIKEKLHALGYDTPLIADIHFNPRVAHIAAQIIEKIRINPGNYVNPQKGAEGIREKFIPLIEICKKYGTAMRIGTNQGSLSERIIRKYGVTPKAMVEATMEFLNICKEEDYNKIVISLKSSNTHTMLHSYRLMSARMQAENMYYPFHLGVTEAGSGQEARIKSAIGIGTLLNEGIGDTIRVSLTEAPEKELPVARKIVDIIENKTNSTEVNNKIDKLLLNPYKYEPNKLSYPSSLNIKEKAVVISEEENKNADFILKETENNLEPNKKYIIPYKNRTSSKTYPL